MFWRFKNAKHLSFREACHPSQAIRHWKNQWGWRSLAAGTDPGLTQPFWSPRFANTGAPGDAVRCFFFFNVKLCETEVARLSCKKKHLTVLTAVKPFVSPAWLLSWKLKPVSQCCGHSAPGVALVYKCLLEHLLPVSVPWFAMTCWSSTPW